MQRILERKRKGTFMSVRASEARKKRTLFGSSVINKENVDTVTVSDSQFPGTSNDAFTPVKDGNGAENKQSTPEWRSGRRIIELGHVADQMTCEDCQSDLSLRNIDTETRHGFGSTLYINCHCGVINQVTTNKSHRVGKRGPEVFDVNTKVAIGMMHSGTAFRQVSNLMGTVEVQTLDHKSMKKRESEVSEHISTVAKNSCLEALNQEAEEVETESQSGSKKHLSGTFKYDMGWQKRGSGRSYNSNSGVGTMIGNKTGKIVAFGSRIKSCRKCKFYNNKGKQPPLHECVKNWDGSSKAMEADVGASLVNEVEKNNVQVDVIVMDDDCTTMAKINNSVSHKVTKWSDLNHTKKNLGNNLYNLQKKHKSLTPKVIKYFQKCFSYAVSQCKGNSEKLGKAFQQIVPHAFGDHSACDTWCGYISNPEKYTHKSLPYGKDLVGEELKKDLINVFNVYVKNVEKIAPGASTKDVESFNNIISSKAPKRMHYSGTKSLQNRLNCAVAQKNLGYTYVNQVNTAVGISPGKFYGKLACVQDKTRKRRLEYENSREFKKRKLTHKLNQSSQLAQKELREGVTYMSGIANTCTMSEEKEIPPPCMPPVATKVQDHIEFHRVFCDIETTSLSKDCDITQIAAIYESESFNQYVLPVQSISSGASEVTALKVINNVMYHKGQPVHSVNLKEALVLFLHWLQNVGQCLLIGHNFFKFDLPRLLRSFERCGLLKAFRESVIGAADTYQLYKSVYPDLALYNQQYLVKHFLDMNYDAHDASADVKSLQQLVSSVETKTILQHSICTEYAVLAYQHSKMCDANLCSLAEMIGTKTISKDMAKKIASSGLNLSHLKLAVRRNGFEGLRQLFQEKMDNGKPRVTSMKKIIENAFKFIDKT